MVRSSSRNLFSNQTFLSPVMSDCNLSVIYCQIWGEPLPFLRMLYKSVLKRLFRWVVVKVSSVSASSVNSTLILLATSVRETMKSLSPELSVRYSNVSFLHSSRKSCCTYFSALVNRSRLFITWTNSIAGQFRQQLLTNPFLTKHHFY